MGETQSRLDGEPSAPRPIKKSLKPLLAKAHMWAKSLIMNDPRHGILDFFREGDHRGPLGYLETHSLHMDPEGPRSQHFAVYRPTSLTAFGMMMNGTATGKGLNIKGKSAKRGELSGFVPYLQIAEEADKKKIGTSPPDGRVQIYYHSREMREQAITIIGPVLGDMIRAASTAKEQLRLWKDGVLALDDAHLLPLCEQEVWFMADPRIILRDEYIRHEPGVSSPYGIDIPERLFVEVYIMRVDISHKKGWETGRPSEPAYMDLNLHSTRDPAGIKGPKAVVWQYDKFDPMNPRGLLLAYAEETVKPVASDVDAFLVGSRGMTHVKLPPEQVMRCPLHACCNTPVTGSLHAR